MAEVYEIEQAPATARAARRLEDSAMKVTVDIDCTPEEARAFLGLPNVEKLQETVIEEMRKRMAKGLSTEDMQSLFKLWMPFAGKGFEDIQKMFWPAATGKTGNDR